MTPHLVFVVNNAAFFASHRLQLGRAALDAGFAVTVATPASPALTALRQEGFAVRAIPLGRRSHDPLRELASVRALTRLYRELRPDVVHHVTVKPVLYGSIAARLARVPSVVNAVSGLGYVFLANGLAASARRAAVLAAYRLAFGHPNLRVVFQNDADAGLFLEAGLVAPSQVVLIRGSGVDLAEFSPGAEAPGPPIVLLAARMLRDKGIEEFVAAARQLREAGRVARFVLAGTPDDGNPSSVSESRLTAWVREGVVEWWGERADMPAVLAGSQIVCLPSYREGMPRVLLEAAACGRPVVTTDVPGCRDAIRPDETGLLVPVRDAAALAAAIARLLEDHELRRRFGAAARRHAEAHFDVRGVARDTLAVYRALLERGRPGADGSSA